MLADAAPEAGLGHLARSTGLAQALGAEGIEPVCLGLGASDPIERGGVSWKPAPKLASGEKADTDVLVLDSYQVGPDAIRAWAPDARVVAFWDERVAPAADLLISFALKSPDRDGLWGPPYACLGRDYWDSPDRKIKERVERILIAAGGTDATKVSGTLRDAADGAAPDAEVVPAGGHPSLRAPLLEADLVVTAAGQTMLEALASGTPCIAVPVVPNQRPGAELLGELGVVRIVEPGDTEGLRREIAALATGRAARATLSVRGMDCVDGRGAVRVAAKLSRL